MLAGHLNRCHERVEGGKLRGTFLFEPMHALSSTHCQFEAQMVNVVDGIADLYVEHRGAGSALKLPCSLMIGKLRQLGATEVTTPHKRTDLCHIIYQICGKHLTSASTATRCKTGMVERANRLCFTLAAVRREDLNMLNPSTT